MKESKEKTKEERKKNEYQMIINAMKKNREKEEQEFKCIEHSFK